MRDSKSKANTKKENKKTTKQPSSLNELIIDEAVKQYKEGKITNGLDVENFLDGLLQPLMQKLLDAELENHLEHPRYKHSKNKKNRNKKGIVIIIYNTCKF